MNDWGIRSRVLLLALIPTLLIALVMGLYFIGARFSDLESSLNERGRTIAVNLAYASEFGVATADKNNLKRLLQSARDIDSDLVAAAVFDKNNRLFASTGSPAFIEGLLQEVPENLSLTSTRTTEQGLIFYAPIIEEQLPLSDWEINENPGPPQQSGYIALMMTQDFYKLRQYQTVFTSILILIIGTLLGGFLAQRMARSVTAPIIKLARAVNRIKDGNLDTRVEIPSGGELKQLETGINAMAGTLKENRDEMQQHIEQATADLNETLETLEIRNLELEIARKEALEGSRIKTEFLANMSHEIRTPMNSMIGFTDLMLKTELTGEQKDFLHNIKMSASSLLSIINDILDYSKIEADKMSLESLSFDLRETVDEVLSLLGPGATDKGLELIGMVYSDVPMHLLGDPVRIKQIVTNLVSNAIKFTESGTIEIRAELADDGEQDCLVRVSVKDTGIGLSEDQQHHLFAPFNQADASTSRRFGGTGLGLVISKKLVEKMGGEMGVESQVGEGSTFWFSFKARKNLGKVENLRPDNFLVGKRVLVHDQHPTTLNAVASLLRQWRMDVVCFEEIDDLITGLDAATESGKDVQLVIVGGQRLKRSRAQINHILDQVRHMGQCHLLTLTNSAEPALLSGLAAAGVSKTLIKPITQRNLYNALVELLRQRQEPVATAPEESSALPGAGNIYVLAVDDNAANLRLVTALLDNIGVKVDSADSGSRAVSLSKDKVYDLIFMDIQMPEMDGLEATRTIRANNTNRQTPIVALTAHALASEREQLLAAGMDDYMSKPVSESDLTAMLGKWTGELKAGTSERAPEAGNRARVSETIDWSLSVEIAGGNEALAEEMLTLLRDSLPETVAEIRRAYDAQDYSALLTEVHKLHGASCYCGTARLRKLAHDYETCLKNESYQELDRLHEKLLKEISKVRKAAEKFLSAA